MQATRVHDLQGAELVTVADLDRDGWDDLVYTSWDLGELWIAWNQHDGAFTLEQTATGLPKAHSVEVRNVLNRERPQILVSAYEQGGGHFIFVNIAGVWQRFTITTDYRAKGLTAGHINHDGLMDVVSITHGADGCAKVWKNLDSGAFALMATLPVVDPTSVHLADMDGDGSLDIVVSDADGALWWRHRGGFVFDPPVRLASGLGQCSYVLPVDLHRNGNLCIAVASQPMGLRLFEPDGTPIPQLAEQGGLYHLAAGALVYPPDGRVHLVGVSGDPSHEVALYQQQVDGLFAKVSLATSYTTGRSVAIGDFLHNGKPQLVTTSYGLGRVDYWTEA